MGYVQTNDGFFGECFYFKDFITYEHVVRKLNDCMFKEMQLDHYRHIVRV